MDSIFKNKYIKPGRNDKAGGVCNTLVQQLMKTSEEMLFEQIMLLEQ